MAERTKKYIRMTNAQFDLCVIQHKRAGVGIEVTRKVLVDGMKVVDASKIVKTRPCTFYNTAASVLAHFDTISAAYNKDEPKDEKKPTHKQFNCCVKRLDQIGDITEAAYEHLLTGAAIPILARKYGTTFMRVTNRVAEILERHQAMLKAFCKVDIKNPVEIPAPRPSYKRVVQALHRVLEENESNLQEVWETLAPVHDLAKRSMGIK